MNLSETSWKRTKLLETKGRSKRKRSETDEMKMVRTLLFKLQILLLKTIFINHLLFYLLAFPSHLLPNFDYSLEIRSQ